MQSNEYAKCTIKVMHREYAKHLKWHWQKYVEISCKLPRQMEWLPYVKICQKYAQNMPKIDKNMHNMQA